MGRPKSRKSESSGKRRGVKRPVSHVISTVGKGIFERLLDPTWVPNKLYEDYAKDYHVEGRDAEEFVTGHAFYVQLKSTAVAKYCFGARVISQKMDGGHPTHFADEVKLPVFLVVTDNAKEKAYYIWIQEYLRSREDWRDRASVTVHIPTANDLSDRDAFAEAVSRAVQGSRLSQASLQERLGYEVASMEAEDPRFRVHPTITKDESRFHLEPLEPVTVRMTLDGPASVITSKATDLIDRGQPVDFAPGELTFKGSKLFEKFNRTGGRVRISRHQPATASVILYDESGALLADLSSIPGTLEGGRKEVQFCSNLPGAAFELGVGPIPVKRGGYQLKFDSIAWEGQPLLRASYFDQTYKFIRAIPKAAETVLEVYVHGNLEWSKTLTRRNDTEGIEASGEHLELIRMARVVASRFGMNPVLRVMDLGQPEQARWIRTLHQLATNQWAAVPLSKPMPICVDVATLEAYEGGEVSLSTRAQLRPSLFNERIEIAGWHHAALVRVTIRHNAEQIETAKRHGADWVMVELLPTPTSLLGVKLSDEWEGELTRQ